MKSRKINNLFGNISNSLIRQIVMDFMILVSGFCLAVLADLKSSQILGMCDIAIMALSISCALLVLFMSGFYQIIVRYATLHAAVPVGIALLTSLFLAVGLIWSLESTIQFSQILIYFFFSFTGILGIRFMFRDFLAYKKTSGQSRVLIYGAGEAGRQLVSSFNSSSNYAPVLFTDDDVSLTGLSIMGLRVFGAEAIEELVNDFDINVVVLAIPSLSDKRRKEILSLLRELNVEVQIIPCLSELMSNSIDRSDVRSLSIDDILGRPAVPPDQSLLSCAINGVVIMVTGAGGSIGSEICRQILLKAPAKLILFDMSEYALYLITNELSKLCENRNDELEIVPIIGSVQNYEKLKSTIELFKITKIFHAAAYKHVPLVEMNIIEGVNNNVFGTKALVDAAVDSGVSQVTLISTDKAVRPTNIMGATKRMAEFICSMSNATEKTKISMVRFGNVLGSSGSVVPLFEKQIDGGGPVSVTHPDITRYFMTIKEAAQLVIQSSAIAKGGEVFVLDMGQPIKIVDLAISMISLRGKKPVFEGGEESVNNHNFIRIDFSGLRPGEKLYEELLIDDEAVKTNHPLIMSAVDSLPSKKVLQKSLELLKVACEKNDVKAVIKVLIEAGTGLEHDAVRKPKDYEL